MLCDMHSTRSLVLFLLLSVTAALAQTRTGHTFYSRLNSFGFFGEYSNDSSHILLGSAQNRKLLDFGGFYSRRVFLNRIASGQYMIELRPVMWESDPLTRVTEDVTQPPYGIVFSAKFAQAPACHPSSSSYTTTIQNQPFSQTTTITCGGRQWTFGEGFSPVGFIFNFLPHDRIQPVVSLLGGYMFSTKPIPISTAKSANFTFEFGAGFEFYRTATRSVRVEYRLQHLSNADTAVQNPGIDNQLVQVTYAFGH